MTREEQLRRQVEVLRELAMWAALGNTIGGTAFAIRSLADADRIAAEPVEATDWEVVWEWVVAKRNRAMTLDAESLRLWVEDGNPVFEGGLPTAAAWIRAQKEAGNV